MCSLEDYLESVSNLPSKVQSNFSNLRELDEKCLRLVEEIQIQALQVIEQDEQAKVAVAGGVKRSRRTAVTDSSVDAKLDPLIKQAHQTADEKVKVASSTYDLVDKHIQRLDAILRKAEDEVRERIDQASLEQLQAPVQESGGGSTRRKEALQKLRAAAASASANASVLAMPAGAPRGRNPDLDLPIDPNEPTYCVCNRVSFGQMIACDHLECKIEWFHFECVGLNPETHNTKAKWYCSECASLRKKTK
eukprot:CAMPEP_0196589336 /NCGR_PEP_ID=MMETSP1081-20130531/63265_1 /TAXON_ID=36882 /ORGANISM="Pyramimonas amylifera, Strain CCMP720" /LENGTH=248 /DNA_ID=CAMNT_0041912103 /DNA_START=171 /DNA_END=917 /DNA_ORIENTATION=+